MIKLELNDAAVKNLIMAAVDECLLELKTHLAETASKEVLLSRQEAAKYLRCSPSSIDRFVREGKLNKYGFNDSSAKVYFKQSEILNSLRKIN